MIFTGLKIKAWLIGAAAFVLAALFMALKLIGIGKKAAKAEIYEKQQEIEDDAQYNLELEVKKSDENIKKGKAKLSNSDFSSLNDTD